MVDLASFIAPLEGDPVGPDLSYDADRTVIEAAFATSASGERASETNWPEVIARIQDQAQRTRDLWLAIFLARAGAQTGRLEMVELGTQVLASLVELYWDRVHPQLEEVGYLGRRGACDSLARHGEFVLPLRRVTLIAHPRLGNYSALDLERFALNGEQEDGYGMFRAAIEQIDVAEIDATIDRLDHIRDALRRTDAVLNEQAGDDTGTDFKPTYAALAQIREQLASFSGTAAPADAAAGAEPSGTDAGGADPAASANGARGVGGAAYQGGRLETRDDVLRALDAIGDYYRRREPGSAVPIALRRTREWVSMSFIDVLADIAPTSMDDARRVLMSQAIIAESDRD